MATRRWSDTDPRNALERLQREINDVFNDDYRRESRGLFDRASSPPIDIVEEQDDFKVYCDLPGVSNDNLDLSIANNVLTIKGEKREPSSDSDRALLRCETWTGAFQRTLSLPSTVDPSGVEAKLSDGVLEVALPKREELKPKQINVAVK